MECVSHLYLRKFRWSCGCWKLEHKKMIGDLHIDHRPTQIAISFFCFVKFSEPKLLIIIISFLNTYIKCKDYSTPLVGFRERIREIY